MKRSRVRLAYKLGLEHKQSVWPWRLEWKELCCKMPADESPIESLGSLRVVSKKMRDARGIRFRMDGDSRRDPVCLENYIIAEVLMF